MSECYDRTVYFVMWFEVPVSKTIEYDLSILYGKVRRVS